MKKFISLLLAVLIVSALAVTALADTKGKKDDDDAPRHDNGDCSLSYVTLKLDGESYVNENEYTIRLPHNTRTITFDAEAILEHANDCDEKKMGSSEVTIYYSLNGAKRKSLETSSNPGGRDDVRFRDVSLPKSVKLAEGDKLTIDFFYDNAWHGSSKGTKTLVSYYFIVGNANGYAILDENMETAGPGEAEEIMDLDPAKPATKPAKPTTADKEEKNPNTGLGLFFFKIF